MLLQKSTSSRKTKHCSFNAIAVLFLLIIIWNLFNMIKQNEHHLIYTNPGSAMQDTLPMGWRYNTPFPVDVVYTWVNGSDPEFQDSVKRVKSKLMENEYFSESRAETIASFRFADYNSLLYSLRSLEKHANWIRHVFIVTNGQIPRWLNISNRRLTIIKHDEIFADPGCLPTFSSRAIEHNIHKINGLSQKFIYMNDDFFFGRDVTLEDFYTEVNGTKIYLRINAKTECNRKCNRDLLHNGVCDDMCNFEHCAWDGGDCENNATTMKSRDSQYKYSPVATSVLYTNAVYNRKFGERQRKIVAHTPVLIDKDVKEDLDKKFWKEVNNTIHHRLRSVLDFQFQFSYMHFLMDAYNDSMRFETYVFSKDVAYIVLKPSIAWTREFINKLKESRAKFICINDEVDRKDSKISDAIDNIVNEFYSSKFPNPSSFETRTIS